MHVAGLGYLRRIKQQLPHGSSASAAGLSFWEDLQQGSTSKHQQAKQLRAPSLTLEGSV